MMNGPESHWSNHRWQQATIPCRHDNRERRIKSIRLGQYLMGFKALSPYAWPDVDGRRVELVRDGDTL